MLLVFTSLALAETPSQTQDAEVAHQMWLAQNREAQATALGAQGDAAAANEAEAAAQASVRAANAAAARAASAKQLEDTAPK